MVRYGVAGGPYTHEVDAWNVDHAVLAGLTPNTTYAYRVWATDGWSESDPRAEQVFTTLP